MIHNIILLAVGILVGAMNAIAGGGMLVGYPALLISGLSALTANATGNIVVLPGQLASAYGYRRYLRQVPKRFALLLVPCITGAALGAFVLRKTTSHSFEALVPWLIILAVGLFAFQPWLHNFLHQHVTGRSKAVRPLVIIAFALFPLSIYGGFFGAGFGFVVLAFLSFTSIKDIHVMNAMKNIAAACIAAVSAAVLATGGFIDWRTGLVMAAGSAVGGYGGARLSQRISNHAIRLLVIAIGIITAIYIVVSH